MWNWYKWLIRTRIVKVKVVYGIESLWSIYWGAWQLENDIENWKASGKRVRSLEFMPVPGANHFVSSLES